MLTDAARMRFQEPGFTRPVPILQEYHKEQVRHARLAMSKLKDMPRDIEKVPSASNPAAANESCEN